MSNLLTPQLSKADLEWLASQGPELWQKDPEFFFRHILKSELWERQLEIALSVRDNRETSVFSCNAAGKTHVGSRICLWFMYAYPRSIVLTTAPTYRQVKDLLWRYIRTAYDASPLKYVKKANTTDLSFATDWYALGLSTNDPDKFVGYHAESGHLLVIADEAAGIDEPIFEVVDAVMSTAETRLLMIGNPTSSSGRFFKSARSKTTKRIKIQAWDTPNFTANHITCWQDLCAIFDPPADWDSNEPYPPPKLRTPNPRLLAPIAVHDMVHKFGVESPWFQARVEAVFPDQGDDTLIPLSWIERAMTKKRREGDWELTGPNGEKKWVDGIPRGLVRYGIDVARFGDDRTVIIMREGDNVREIHSYAKEDTMQTANRILYNFKKTPTAKAFIDTTGGIGAGPADRVREVINDPDYIQLGFRHEVYDSEMASAPLHDPHERFLNLRAQLYWELREKFEKNEIAIPSDGFGEELANELSQIKFKILPGGKIKIELKEELKKRLLRSPDLADALMVSYGSPTLSEFVLQTNESRRPEPLPEPNRERSAYDPVTAGLRDQQF